MAQIQLNWEGPFKISDLRKKFFEERLSDLFKDSTYYWVTWSGIYVFLDENFRVLYVGSATKDCTNPLRTRIREHLKGLTIFSQRLRKNSIDLDDSWQLIAAPFMKDELLKDILKIERIITLEMNSPGNSDDMEIVNYGRCKPLPPKIQAGLSKYKHQM